MIRALQKISNEVVKPRGDSNFFTAAFARADPQDKIVLDTCSAAVTVCASASHCCPGHPLCTVTSTASPSVSPPYSCADRYTGNQGTRRQGRVRSDYVLQAAQGGLREPHPRSDAHCRQLPVRDDGEGFPQGSPSPLIRSRTAVAALTLCRTVVQAPLDDIQAAGGGKTLLDSVVETICDASHWPTEGPGGKPRAPPNQEMLDIVQLKVWPTLTLPPSPLRAYGWDLTRSFKSPSFRPAGPASNHHGCILR